MADGKLYLNKTTGEVIFKANKLVAYRYFKADGKKVGYKVRWKDIVKCAQTEKTKRVFSSNRKSDII